MLEEFKEIESSNSPVYDVFHRLLAISETGAIASGTCVNIASNLVLTAKHVILDFNRRFGEGCYELWVIQITNDDDLYSVWSCDSVIAQTVTDLAVLRVKPYNEKAAALRSQHSTKHVLLRLNPPSVGEPLFAFGYASDSGGTTVSRNGVGGPHFEIKDRPMVTTGVVEEIYPVMRDSSMVSWPCYRVSLASHGGMSGGPVFDSRGHLCGIICTGTDHTADMPSVAHITSLWPIAYLEINFDRGAKYQRGVTYQFVELLRDGLVGSVDWKSIPPEAGIQILQR